MRRRNRVVPVHSCEPAGTRKRGEERLYTRRVHSNGKQPGGEPERGRAKRWRLHRIHPGASAADRYSPTSSIANSPSSYLS